MAADPIIPFDYLERAKRRSQQADPVADPMAATWQAMQQDQLRSTIIQAPDAATTANVTRVARDAGEAPGMVEDRVAEVAKAQQADRFTRVLGQYPAFTGWAIQNPRDAVAASEDHKPVSLIGSAWDALKAFDAWGTDPNVKPRAPGTVSMGSGPMAAGVGFNLADAKGSSQDYTPGKIAMRLGAGSAGLVQGALGVAEGFGEASQAYNPVDWAQKAAFGGSVGSIVADLARARRKAWGQTASEFEQGSQAVSVMGRGFLSGVESVPGSVAALGTTLVTGNPVLGASVLGGTTGGQSYGDARDAGLSVGASLTKAGIDAAIETGTEILPERYLGELAHGAPITKAIGRYLLSELGGEEAATLGQDFNQWAMIDANKGKSFADYAAEIAPHAVDTAIAVLTTGAVMGGAGSIARTLVRQTFAADQATREKALIDAHEKAAADSAYRKRDPEGYAAMVGYVAEAQGHSSVFVPASAVVAYQQSDAYDQFEDPFKPYQAQIDEAAATGGDVVLPADFALGKLPGTAAWSAVKDDLRLQPGGMSAREAEDLNGRLDEVVKELGTQQAASEQATAKDTDARAALVERVTRELQNAGFTPTNASAQAELIAQRVATRAARLGRNMQPGDFDTRIVSVLPPALAEMQQADNVDLVINAMRGGKDATKQTGKSLLDFIASKGGIEDRGGDVAAMGGDKWHKGKVGRRKLLKAFDAAQGNMLGSSGSNPNSVGNLLDAAISEGYFPDLLAMRENGEKIDDRVLLDAIGQELGGTPVYPEAAKVDNVRLAADELRQMLEDQGRDPSGMSDAEVRKAIADHVEAMRGDLGRAFDQALNEGPRGRITLPANGFGTGPATIELFQSRNPSTLLHELSHQWLEELRHDAELPDAPDQLKQDWQTVQDWFKANGHEITDGVIPTEAHELWARGGERYLMEGKSPSGALTRLFETFRGWLLNVYRTVDALRSPISPEIRAVFDRMLATDEEIQQQAQAQAMSPLFTDAAEAGMTGAEFDAYTRQVLGARDKAHADLLAKTMAAIKRRVTKAWNDERRGVVADETERLDAAPILASLRMMKEAPLSLEWLQDRMGQDVTDLLPKRVPPIWREGGANPDSVAEMSGFDSGQQMIEVLIGAERQHRQAKEGGDQRSMRARMIDEAADAEMQRRHGDDPFNDGSIEQEAIAAVNNELAGEVLASEIRILSRKTGQRPTPYKVARDWARGKVRGGAVADEASPGAIQRHARAVAKAGREAEKAMLAGKFDEAQRFKQQQMLSSALLAEAKAAHDEVIAAQARLAKIAKRKTMKTVDQGYLEQAHALLDDIDLGPRSQKSLERQGKWEEWAAAREAEGYDVLRPDAFQPGTHWSKLPVETFLGLDETIAQVMHLGRLKQRLLDNQEQREWDAVFDEAVSGAGNISGPPPADLAEPGWWDALKGKLLGVDAALLKMETVFDWLDGGNSNGVFNRIAFRPVADAQAREGDMLKDYYGRIKALFEAVPGDVAARWNDVLTPPFMDIHTERPMRINRKQAVAMALNIGNAGNLQRLADGYRVNPGAVEQWLNETLTAEEWQFVQGVWDTIDTLWPEIEALEKRVNGVAPEKVEPRSFTTPHGQMRGGYYPAIYDQSRDYRAAENAGKEADLFEGRYTRATTRASSTKERAERVKRPILLDLGVVNRHLGEVIHDISHREAVIQAHRFLSSERVRRAVDAALGPEIGRQLGPWVKFVANSWAQERAGNEGFGKWIGKARANATVVGMGFRATTMVTQIAGYSNSVEVVGAEPMAKALAQFSANPAAAVRAVMEKSGEVRHRMDTLDRDLRSEIAKAAASNPASKLARQAVDAKRFMFHGIGYMDMLVSVPTWMAGYSNAISVGMSEQDAIYAGDKAVRQSQGAGSPKDLAAIQRGTGKWGEALKLMTMFYSYFSAQYQRERTLGRDIMAVDGRRTRSMPKLAARAFFLLILPPLLTEVLRAAAGAGSPPDDDEWWTEWALRKMTVNAIGPIPVVRDVIEPIWQGARGAKVWNPSITPLQRAMDSIVNAGKDAGKLARGEDTKHATKDLLEAAGYMTGLVPGQVASATQFLVDVGEGDAQPKDAWDWIEGLSTGKIKE
ncbi:hypothetical protein UFOVP5_7 [uncultured Caudovirales phage]|uniref:Large polyvalent protein associated domain-containing protein n=1 Tax=uncultured Caudovirales phage TaxID=2100421 RepID=A0A6J5KK54_9CAUD|nr:hypothetical protein UFOVP5_7 [uncultured Caudovirales phage]